jgi:hypothetical protein
LFVITATSVPPLQKPWRTGLKNGYPGALRRGGNLVSVTFFPFVSFVRFVVILSSVRVVREVRGDLLFRS